MGLVKADELVKYYGFPRNHVMKVIRKLAQLGYVRTVQGRSGGMELAVSPEKINIGQVARELEPTLEAVNCFTPPCPLLQSNCMLKGIIGEGMNAFLGVLDQRNLAELVKPAGKEKATLKSKAAIDSNDRDSHSAQ